MALQEYSAHRCDGLHGELEVAPGVAADEHGVGLSSKRATYLFYYVVAAHLDGARGPERGAYCQPALPGAR